MLICRGVILVGMSPPRGQGTEGGALASWAVRYKTIAVGTHLHLLGGGMPTDMERSGWAMVPQRTLYRPLASDLATANSTCLEAIGLQAFCLLLQETGLRQWVQPLKKDQVA